MKERVAGFDLARAYAIFGMFIVNFHFSFGAIMAPTDGLGRFMNLFTGNSTAIFIVCAGMGVSLMTAKSHYTPADKAMLKMRVVKRSWFLVVLGLLLYNWWPGDILHFYGGYMHFAAFLLFVPNKYFLWLAVAAIAVFHALLFVIPINTGWNFVTFEYTDFWTPQGFLRNTFYNGWNSMFPWLAYFFTGMWLGRKNWKEKKTRRNIFLAGLALFLVFQALRFMVKQQYFNPYWSNYIMAEYFPPYLPFMMITMGFAFMVISFCMFIGEQFPASPVIKALQQTGQMTLTHYVLHLTAGMLLFSLLVNKQYTGLLVVESPIATGYILGYAVLFYLFSVLFSIVWRKKFKHGPLEALMRKISG